VNRQHHITKRKVQTESHRDTQDESQRENRQERDYLESLGTGGEKDEPQRERTRTGNEKSGQEEGNMKSSGEERRGAE